MISNQILQNTIEGLKAISRVDFIVMDTDGNEVAATTTEEGDYKAATRDFVKSPADSQEFSRYQFFTKGNSTIQVKGTTTRAASAAAEAIIGVFDRIDIHMILRITAKGTFHLIGRPTTALWIAA